MAGVSRTTWMTLISDPVPVRRLVDTFFRETIHVTVGQLWIFAVTAVSVLSGAFGFGWTVSDWNRSGKITALETSVARQDLKIEDLNQAHDEVNAEFDQLKTKERVLRLFYFYHLAKLKEERARTDVELAQKSMDALIPFERPVFPASAFLPDEVRAMRAERLRDYEAHYREYYEGLTEEQQANVDQAQSLLAQAKESFATAQDSTYEAGEGFESLFLQEEGRARDLEIKLANISKGGGGVGTIKTLPGVRFATPGCDMEPRWGIAQRASSGAS